MRILSIVALKAFQLPHRKLAAGEALDFDNDQDRAFFVSRQGWSAFRCEFSPAPIDAQADHALREASLRIAHLEDLLAAGLKDQKQDSAQLAVEIKDKEDALARIAILEGQVVAGVKERDKAVTDLTVEAQARISDLESQLAKAKAKGGRS